MLNLNDVIEHKDRYDVYEDDNGNTVIREKKNFYFQSNTYPCGGYFEIIRFGQQKPENGDSVLCEVQAHLPTNPNLSLRDDLRFGNRIEFFGESLNYGWGNNGDMRYTNMILASETTWKGCFQKAREYAEKQFSNLESMIENRKKALENAEQE